MRLITRIQTLMAASVNDLLERAENPEAMANQIVRDMEQAMAEMRENTASVMATARLTEKKLERAQGDRDLWLRNAESAVREEKDELAKKALLRKRAMEQNISLLNAQLAESCALQAKMKEELKLVESRLHEVRLKRENLIARRRAAATLRRLHDCSARFDRVLERTTGASDVILEGYESFTRFEERIERQLAEVEAREELRGTTLEKEFERMKRDRELEEELGMLKRLVLGCGEQAAPVG